MLGGFAFGIQAQPSPMAVDMGMVLIPRTSSSVVRSDGATRMRWNTRRDCRLTAKSPLTGNARSRPRRRCTPSVPLHSSETGLSCEGARLRAQCIMNFAGLLPRSAHTWLSMRCSISRILSTSGWAADSAPRRTTADAPKRIQHVHTSLGFSTHPLDTERILAPTFISIRLPRGRLHAIESSWRWCHQKS